MSRLTNITIQWSEEAKKWVVKHESIMKPINERSTYSVTNLFLSKTELRILKERIEEVLGE